VTGSPDPQSAAAAGKAAARSMARRALGGLRGEVAATALRQLSGRTTDRRAQLTAARGLSRLGRVDEAIAATRAVLDRNPGDPDATLLLGRLLQRSGDRDQAVDTVVAAGRRKGAKPVVVADAAATLLGWHRYAELHHLLAGPDEDTFRAVLAATPAGRRDALLAGRAGGLLETERPGDALAVFDEIADVTALDRRAIPTALLRKEARRLRAVGDTWLATALAELAQIADPENESTGKLLKWLDEVSDLGDRGYPWPAYKGGDDRYVPERSRVLYLVDSSLPWASGGYARRTQGLLTALRRAGLDAGAVTRYGYPQDEDEVTAREVVDGVPYHRLTEDGGRPIPVNSLVTYVERYAQRLKTLARAERPAILHAVSDHRNGLAAALVGAQLGIPTVYEVRDLAELTRGSREPGYADTGHHRAMARMEAEAAAAADHVFVATAALRDEMVRRGLPPEHLTVLPHGVDVARVTPRPRDEELAAELGLAGRTVLGHVGPPTGHDGLGLLLEAVARLRRDTGDLAVLLLGSGTAHAELVGRVERLGLADVVTVTGAIPETELDRYHSLLDVAVFPQLPVPVGELVAPPEVVEAMARGTAVVVSDVAALTEVVTDGLTGLVHAKGDAGALTDVLRRAIGDPALRRDLAEAATKWVRAERDWAVLAARVDAVYRSLTADGTR
jgi:glycosyltransferase involved in cell wall biosynthesis